ncbi:hypothetical protein F5Y18DRAFT_444077 [Xylariaceae sp. FL1019]|nr:hypothetical protein F5Y18DRAFT_444077 [Xylariaceae sp. FL1019]
MATTTAELRVKLFNNFFEQEDDQRFVCEQQIGKGGQSFVFKVKWYASFGTINSQRYYADVSELRWITLKVASFANHDELDNLQAEAEVLKVLSGCAHTIHMHDVHDDPLQGLKDQFAWAWIYLEYLPHGTLGQFIERYSMAGVSGIASQVQSPEASQAVSRAVSPSRSSTLGFPTVSQLNYQSQTATGLFQAPTYVSSQLPTASQLGGLETASPPRLPNRLLLKLFLCMVRACIAMAWPEHNRDGNPELASRIPLGRPKNIKHNDIHMYNMMFGPLYDDEEHAKVPILKLIDFGLATMEGAVRSARQANVADVGTLMATVMCALTDRRYSGEEIVLDLSDMELDEELETPASRLLPDPDARRPIDPLPDIDMDLRRVVAACIASTPEKRPTLRWLENVSTA